MKSMKVLKYDHIEISTGEYSLSWQGNSKMATWERKHYYGSFLASSRGDYLSWMFLIKMKLTRLFYFIFCIEYQLFLYIN